MATAMLLCQSCQEETKYHCLSCQASVCNRSECSVPAPEETPNWKAGSKVAFCMTCKTSSKHTAAERKRRPHRHRKIREAEVFQELKGY